MSAPASIAAINRLPPAERDQFYGMLAPPEIFEQFAIDPDTFTDPQGNPLLLVEPQNNMVRLSLYHKVGARDPLMFFQLSDTPNYRILVMLAVIIDPDTPRYDADIMPDGTRTHFGTFKRNLETEQAAMEAGLAPGQLYKGLRLMRPANQAFERFIERLSHDRYYAEPLYYHNAVNFERMGFNYQQGRRFMESINFRFTPPDGDLVPLLDGSTPFRQPAYAGSIRGRSWAIHDGIMGEPYTGVHMYKRIGHHAGISTFPDAVW